MANFPGPKTNRLIDQDPQIVKTPMDNMGWGARASIMPKDGKAPAAPEMTIKHTS